MIYGKNLTAIIIEEGIDNASNIEAIDLIDLPLKGKESVKKVRITYRTLHQVS